MNNGWGFDENGRPEQITAPADVFFDDEAKSEQEASDEIAAPAVAAALRAALRAVGDGHRDGLPVRIAAMRVLARVGTIAGEARRLGVTRRAVEKAVVRLRSQLDL